MKKQILILIFLIAMFITVTSVFAQPLCISEGQSGTKQGYVVGNCCPGLQEQHISATNSIPPSIVYKCVSSSNGKIITRIVSLVSDGTQTITYTVSNTDSKWGATIEDNVVGCTFPSGGTTYQALMLSTSGNTKTVTVTGTNCQYSGNYQFGEGTIVDFNDTDNESGSIPWVWIIVFIVGAIIIFFILNK